MRESDAESGQVREGISLKAPRAWIDHEELAATEPETKITHNDDESRAHRNKFKQDSALLARIKSFVRAGLPVSRLSHSPQVRFWLTHRRRKLALLSPLNRQEATVADRTAVATHQRL
eukprot:344734-Hanusia_phi.AAC.2